MRHGRPPAVLVLVSLVLGLTSVGQTAADAALAPASTSTGSNTQQPRPDVGSWTSPQWQPPNTCRGVFDGPPRGSLVKTTSAGPSGGAVAPGQTITVTLTWKSSDFSGKRPFLTEDCVEIGSRFSKALSQVHILGPTGGTDTFTYFVPAGGTGGQPICDRAVASGLFDPWTGWGNGGDGNSGHGDEGQTGGSWVGGSGSGASGGGTGGSGWDDGKSSGGDGPEKSAVLCYSILDPATPEASNVLFLPAAGFLVVGAALLVVRRRQADAVRR